MIRKCIQKLVEGRNLHDSEAHQARSEALAIGKASGDIYILTIVNLSLAEVLRQQGKLPQVIDICERQLKSADKRGISESALVGWLFGIWGEVLAELNHLDRAIDQAKKGVKLAARGRDAFHIASSPACPTRGSCRWWSIPRGAPETRSSGERSSGSPLGPTCANAWRLAARGGRTYLIDFRRLWHEAMAIHPVPFSQPPEHTKARIRRGREHWIGQPGSPGTSDTRATAAPGLV